MPYLSSAASASATTTLPTTEWWIKDPLGYEEDVLIHVQADGPLRRERIQQSATYRPIGRKYPIIVTDKIEGYNGSLKLEFINDDASLAKVLALFETQRVLLLQSGWLAEQMYVRFRDNWQEDVHNTDPPHRVISIDYIEQPQP